ncbi:Major capsid protein GpE [uncultured Caudovirales phage]|uniref:Major capsid protein GpE n=1 Tax=uncultured Caudovirales phage TaxID=2100421 RepID=A0A6J7WS17_9CAUD|nr:Major capsid protein GpE [uncultured Caudovirales phage]CAB5220809.1 Major capsid protein GpE [uncultured Caudovirales phage]
MPMLTPSAVHVDTPLTNLTIAYLQDQGGFIADKVFPRVPVEKKTNKYFIYNRADFNRVGQVQLRAPRTKAPVVGMSLSQDTYSAEVYSLATNFDFETLSNADAALDIRSAGAQMLTYQLLIDREIKWATKYFSASVWGTDWAGVSSAPSTNQVRQWSDYTNSTPIQDVTAIMQAIQLKSGGFKPNVMVVGKQVRDKLINHTDILGRLNGGATVTNTALVTDAKLAEIFGVEEFLVMETVKNTAAEGLTESNAFIGGKSAAFYYRPKAAGLMVPSAGYTFTWNENNASGYGIDIRSYTGDFLRVEGIAELLEANLAYDQKVVSTDLGGFITTVIA